MLLALFLLISAPAQAAPWQLWQASILLPLPRAAEESALLSPSTIGDGGALLPADIVAKLPTLVAAEPRDEVFQQKLKVVALRLDPCFREGTETQCRHQIRFIWQPLREVDGTVRAEDAALHSFYDLNDSEWNSFLAAYNQGRQNGNFPNALGVHPLIAQEGLSGPTWHAMKALVLRYAGARRLSRVTQMTLDFNGNQWVFRGFDVKNGTLQPISIARVKQPYQVVSMQEVESPNLRATIFPTAFNDTGLWFFDDPIAARDHFPDSALQDLAREFLRTENPLKENTGTVDCASCHVAQQALDWQKRNQSQWDWPKLSVADQFLQTKQPLANGTKSAAATSRLRAFGYQGTEPTVADRTLNETAHVIDQLP